MTAARVDWRIYYDPPPIPLRTMDWHYVHEGYDGAPDSHDIGSGHAESYEAAIQRIKEHLDDHPD